MSTEKRVKVATIEYSWPITVPAGYVPTYNGAGKICGYVRPKKINQD
jgi:hypothetical protein